MLMILAAAASIAYHATVLKVVDGDTITVHVQGWPAPFDPIGVRIFGLDAPEHQKPPAQTVCEVAMGLQARAYARTLVKPGQAVTVTYTKGVNDKYGRLLGRVTLPDGHDWSDVMISAGMARPYGNNGSLHKDPWCVDPPPASAPLP